MENVILTIHLILALLLIGVVLLQRSEGGGLLSSGGGAMSGRQAANALTKLTWIFAICFIGTSITLTVLAARDAKGVSVVDQLPTENSAPATPTPTPTIPEADLLPPSTSDAPATPPASE